MKITYYLEILSSWCYWAEPTWAELKRRYAGRAEFSWRIALMNREDFPSSREQCDWFYRRSGGTVMNSPFMLNSGWFEAARKGNYEAPNLVAEAARGLGVEDDRVRLALMEAALRQGLKVGDLAKSVAIAANAAKLNPRRLLAAAKSDSVRKRVKDSTAEFHAHRISQRPSFVLEDAIGDKAVFSGLVRLEPLAATLDSMLSDTAAYKAHKAHHGEPPSS